MAKDFPGCLAYMQGIVAIGLKASWVAPMRRVMESDLCLYAVDAVHAHRALHHSAHAPHVGGGGSLLWDIDDQRAHGHGRTGDGGGVL